MTLRLLAILPACETSLADGRSGGSRGFAAVLLNRDLDRIRGYPGCGQLDADVAFAR
jgi:hypothetical protein